MHMINKLVFVFLIIVQKPISIMEIKEILLWVVTWVLYILCNGADQWLIYEENKLKYVFCMAEQEF